jgi:hypothetical protein
VTFTRPFRLKGVEGTHPAGAYPVDTDENLIDGLSFLSWQRVATMIYLRNADGATEVHVVDPIDLEAAILRDAEIPQSDAPQRR